MFASKDIFLTAPSGGYTIARSVRLRSTGYLTRTLSTPTNNKIFTWSSWVKRGDLGGVENDIFVCRSAGSPYGFLTFRNTGSPYPNAINYADSVSGVNITTSAVYRDPSAWYHIVLAVDTTQATSTNRVKLYVNGVQVTSFASATYPTLNAGNNINTASAHCIGNAAPFTTTEYLDGYLTEINFIDGQQLTPSSFGETDSITGVWKPKAYSGTYGTNGFELNFSDNSNNTAATIGKDYSGNGNNWTPNNISVTAGATYDSMVDSPTVGASSSNYCVVNPLDKGTGMNITNGNLQHTADSSGNWYQARCTFGLPSTGKWYWELTFNSGTAGFCAGGIAPDTMALTMGFGPGTYGNVYGMILDGTLVANNASTGSYGSSFSSGSVLMVAFDRDNSKIYFGKDGTWFNSSNPATQTSPAASSISTTANLFPFVGGVNASGGASNWGQRPFSYTPPTGFVALNTYNLPASTITNGAAYMAATTYTGNVTARNISNAVNGVSFQPDFVWLKNRTTAYGHVLQDSIRGTSVYLASNSTAADTAASLVTAFNSDGFAVSTSNVVNENSAGIVGWQWKAGGTSSSNTNGSITSTVSVGATQGFSVVTYTGNGTNGATIGHGLGATPSMIIVKDRGGHSNNWAVWNSGFTTTSQTLFLDLTVASTTYTNRFDSSGFTSSVFKVGTTIGEVNTNTYNYVAYCFSAVAGYSAFGSYTGNGSADGPFIYTGFRPRFFMYKRTDSAGSWVILDSSRNPSNVTTQYLYPNASDAEVAAVFVDFVSNGVKFRTTYTDTNGSGFSYIYACFAESPFKTSLAR